MFFLKPWYKFFFVDRMGSRIIVIVTHIPYSKYKPFKEICKGPGLMSVFVSSHPGGRQWPHRRGRCEHAADTDLLRAGPGPQPRGAQVQRSPGGARQLPHHRFSDTLAVSPLYLCATCVCWFPRKLRSSFRCLPVLIIDDRHMCTNFTMSYIYTYLCRASSIDWVQKLSQLLHFMNFHFTG